MSTTCARLATAASLLTGASSFAFAAHPVTERNIARVAQITDPQLSPDGRTGAQCAIGTCAGPTL